MTYTYTRSVLLIIFIHFIINPKNTVHKPSNLWVKFINYSQKLFQITHYEAQRSTRKNLSHEVSLPWFEPNQLKVKTKRPSQYLYFTSVMRFHQIPLESFRNNTHELLE